jgi:hypothetical protein
MNHTFAASWLLRGGLLLMLIGCPSVCWLARQDEAAIYVCFMCLAGFIAMFFFWPRAIHFDDDEIWQRDLLGRVKRISWQAVDSLGHVASEGKTIVGGGETEIVHTQFHGDKGLFCRLIEQRTGITVFVGGF